MYIYEQIFLNIAILSYTAVIKFCTCLFERYRSYHSVILFIITYDTSYTVKPVLSGYSKKDETMVLKKGGSLMQGESIAQNAPLEHSAILLTCIKRLSVLKIYFMVLF